MKPAPQEICLWLLPIDEEAELPLHLLSPAELLRHQRFTRPLKRAELLHSRLLLRAALYHFAPEALHHAEAIPDVLGRPFWEVDGKRIPLYFSLSHCHGFTALAVAQVAEVGCDIEKIRPRHYEKELAQQVFSKEELNHWQKLNQIGKEPARDFFYRAWTLKEAWVKATGTGLRTPFSSLECALLEPQKDGLLHRDNWHFLSLCQPAGYALALATTLQAPTISITQKDRKELLSSLL
ncbi:4'-phosphopantetheinyl transferase superfamily protein [Desulforhopalus vacuolatus]|uniref:4'-phosphopantetheinyl transferase family protein n=1 Tax=Desulforhopalus vacuolatus TaxID=40414 RepID=UPI0019628CB7|nr:4'-phosphopantetheinyl transferase superfamily protein [Desulforhopalus vacuolatus]MBM9521096.1 4'-phosphopantetheinyl transferase superfamily protein [Desulforhopalus vacuolatus]